jgi:light-regulated signal transduction histidine kinase (bacteriophytochrome)
VSDSAIRRQILEAQATIEALEVELAETNRGLVALTLELEQRVDERTRELRGAHAELQQTNAELLQLTAELKAANQELEAFSYSVSHDLRAPLQSVLSFTELLIERGAARLDAHSQQYLQRQRAGCQLMVQIINDMLALSLVTRSEIRHETVDLSLVAQNITNRLALTEPQRRVEFVVAAGMMANGDVGLLSVALENLLGNAWKFTSKKPGARIEFGGVEHPPTYFVRDNGAGFDMATADKLFGAFQRLHSASEFPGTGIGLATVARIIHRHDGRIWAEAAVGQGATFYFTLSG